jgi:hypothetical protein
VPLLELAARQVAEVLAIAGVQARGAVVPVGQQVLVVGSDLVQALVGAAFQVNIDAAELVDQQIPEEISTRRS